MRPIDGDALLAEYDRVHEGPPGRARKLIEQAPAIESEIIRCKDCKYFMFDNQHKGVNCVHDDGLITSSHDDFCSYAKRRK